MATLHKSPAHRGGEPAQRPRFSGSGKPRSREVRLPQICVESGKILIEMHRRRAVPARHRFLEWRYSSATTHGFSRSREGGRTARKRLNA